MKTEQLLEYAEIAKQQSAGKTRQYRIRGTDEWYDCHHLDDEWYFDGYEYRIKSAPREVWLVGDDNSRNGSWKVHACIENRPVGGIKFREVIE